MVYQVTWFLTTVDFPFSRPIDELFVKTVRKWRLFVNQSKTWSRAVVHPLLVLWEAAKQRLEPTGPPGPGPTYSPGIFDAFTMCICIWLHDITCRMHVSSSSDQNTKTCDDGTCTTVHIRVLIVIKIMKSTNEPTTAGHAQKIPEGLPPQLILQLFFWKKESEPCKIINLGASFAGVSVLIIHG